MFKTIPRGIVRRRRRGLVAREFFITATSPRDALADYSVHWTIKQIHLRAKRKHSRRMHNETAAATRGWRSARCYLVWTAFDDERSIHRRRRGSRLSACVGRPFFANSIVMTVTAVLQNKTQRPDVSAWPYATTALKHLQRRFLDNTNIKTRQTTFSAVRNFFSAQLYSFWNFSRVIDSFEYGTTTRKHLG